MNSLHDTMEKSACSDFATRQRVPRRLGAFVLLLFLAVSSLPSRVLAHTDVDATVALINAKLDELTAPNGDGLPNIYGTPNPSPSAPATSVQVAAAVKVLVNAAATQADAVAIASVAAHARPTYAAAITTAAIGNGGLSAANFGFAEAIVAGIVTAVPASVAPIMAAAADAALRRTDAPSGRSDRLDEINNAAITALPASAAAITAETIGKLKGLPTAFNATTNPFPLSNAQKVALTNTVINDAVTDPSVLAGQAANIVKAAVVKVGVAIDAGGLATPMLEEIVKASVAAVSSQRAQIAAVAFNAMYARVGGAGFITTAAQVGTGGSGAAYDAVQAATQAVTTVKTNDGNEANAIGTLIEGSTNGTSNINYVDSIVSGAFASATVTAAETLFVMNRVVDEIKQAGGVSAATRAAAVITTGVLARPDQTSGLLVEALKYRPASEVGSLAVTAVLASKVTGSVAQENTEVADIAGVVLDKDLNVDGVTLNALGTGPSAQRIAILQQLLTADERGTAAIVAKAVASDSTTGANAAATEANKEIYVDAALDQADADVRGSVTYAAIIASAVKTVQTLGDTASTNFFLTGRTAGVQNAINSARETVVLIKNSTTTNSMHPASTIAGLMASQPDDLAVYVAAVVAGAAADASSNVAAGIAVGTVPTSTLIAEAINAWPANAPQINLSAAVAVDVKATPNNAGPIVGFAVRDNPASTIAPDAVIGAIYAAKGHAAEIGWYAAKYAPTLGANFATAIVKHTRLEGLAYFSNGQPIPAGETSTQGETRAAAAITAGLVDSVLKFAPTSASTSTKAGYVKGITTNAINAGLTTIFGAATVGTNTGVPSATNRNGLSKKPDEVKQVKGLTAGALIPLYNVNGANLLATGGETSSIPDFVYGVLQGATSVAAAKPYVQEIAEAVGVVLAVNNVANATARRTAITTYLNSQVPLLDGSSSLTLIEAAYDLGVTKGQNNLAGGGIAGGQKNVAGTLAEFVANQMASPLNIPVTDILGL